MIDAAWIIWFLLLALDLLFTAVRASLVNARLPLLLNLREQRPGPVDRAVTFSEKPRSRVSLRLATVLGHFCFAGISWLLLQRYVSTPLGVGQLLGVLAMTGLVVFLLENGLEGRALPHAEEWLIHLSPVGQAIDLLLSPFSALMMAVMGYSTPSQPSMTQMTEDELKNWVEAGQPEGSLEKGEREMIYSIFHFRNTLAREVMVPRMDVQVLEISTPLAEAIEAMSQTGHSRVPVYEESIDNIVGLLYAKDLLRAKPSNQPLSERRELLRPAYFVPEAKKADELLTEMQLRRVHVAIVVDEYGGVSGLVTLEDIVEEIVGEIQDEYDQAEEMLFQPVGPDEYIFQGRINLDDFNEVMGSHLAKEDADTLGGFIYAEIGRIPAGGESVETDGLVLTVEQVSGRRIRKVRARRIQPKPETEVKEVNVE
ncbi:MAG: hemolysin family protein [Anaerolineaceae bacterium]|nr:hemolysin family protein [Anaerolineaceae bacterium]